MTLHATSVHQDAEAFYRPKIVAESAEGEPELRRLAEFVRAGSTAVDVGANEGIFAYALSLVTNRVVAFEAHPELAAVASRMLAGGATIHQCAISDHSGRATFFVPIADDGMELHFAGNLTRSHTGFKRERTFDVELRTLDSFALSDVSFLKVDVEGSEYAVLAGARETIMRDRPILLLELLAGTHADPLFETERVCRDFSYRATIEVGEKEVDALPAIKALGKNTSWGTHITTRNVIFRPI